MNILDRETGLRHQVTNKAGQELEDLVLDNVADISGEHIPREAQEFYEDFGFLPHPWKRNAKGKPIPVTELADYQLEFWNTKSNTIMLKNNKAGVSTTSHLEMFQSRLLPEEAGFDALLVAQNQKIANMHLLDLKRLVGGSNKYSKYLIRRPDLELFKEEKTKLEVMYIRNPYNVSRPSRILALGSSVPSGFSWKHVNRIHMSDISQIKRLEDTEFFSALYSRLANTNGVIKIETIPGAKRGEYYRIWKKANKQKLDIAPDEALAEDPENLTSTFKPMKITYRDSLKAGIISQAYIDNARRDLDPISFAQIMEAQFVEDSEQWYKEDWFKPGGYDDLEFVE